LSILSFLLQAIFHFWGTWW